MTAYAHMSLHLVDIKHHIYINFRIECIGLWNQQCPDVVKSFNFRDKLASVEFDHAGLEDMFAMVNI